MTERLKMELDVATAELRAHMHSWEYAFGMGASCHGATNHPLLRDARAKNRAAGAPLRRPARPPG